MKNLVIVIIALIVASCSATKALGPTQADVERVSGKFEGGYTLVDLNKGKSLYEENCGICHKLYDPSSAVEESWNRVVPEMVKKLRRKMGENAISDQDQELIRRYVVTMSKH